MPIRLFHTESFRLSAIYAALFIGSMIALMAITYLSIDAAFRAEAVASIDGDLAALKSGYSAEGRGEAVEVINQILSSRETSDVLVLQDRAGHKIAGNGPPVVPHALGILTESEHALGKDGRKHTVLGKVIALGDLYVFAGRDLSAARRAELSVLQGFGWVFVIVLLIGTAGGIVTSRAFLARMDAIAQTCSAIMAGRFGDRIPVRGTQNELDKLAHAINAMLDRIDALMESLKQVSNDIAHDMRTPLTHLRNRLEAAKAGEGTDTPAALDGAIADTDRLLAMFAALLRIAQIEAGTRRASFAPVDLSDVLAHVAGLYQPEAQDRGHTLTVDARSPAVIQGDRQLLLQLFANILENALTHTSPGTAIVIGMKRTDDGTHIAIADNGPGVPASEAQNIFRRFYRLEQSRSSPGTGLGLSMAAAIADLHNATIAAKDNAPGLRIEIVFPNA
ncbi:MAG TPA: HAMP domain-containing sensor histidine kinase [Rhizomicrobium sp.]|nr:HAMP domain-containing sensor histidine kinase [Rhizomicrobium sp.]